MQIGTRVRHKEHGERGVIEDFRHDGHPLVRWEYGNLLHWSVDNLDEENHVNTSTAEVNPR